MCRARIGYVSAEASAGSTLANGLVGWWRGEGNTFHSIGPTNGSLQGGVSLALGSDDFT
jgi:hypothetical protein